MVSANRLAGCVWMGPDERLHPRDTPPIGTMTASNGEFDGVADLVVEGVTPSREEVAVYLGSSR